MKTSREKLRLLLLYSSLAGFSMRTMTDIEKDGHEDAKETLACIFKSSVRCRQFINGKPTKPEQKKVKAIHEEFYDKHILGASYISVYLFFQAKINDVLGSVSTMKKKTIESPYQKEVLKLHGLVSAFLDMITAEFEKHMSYGDAELAKDLEAAKVKIDAFDGFFEIRKREVREAA